jgi:hypothetical protein
MTRPPIYVFDEHNEAFAYWHKARHEGVLTDPLDLLHIDAHNDMSGPERFNKSLYCPYPMESADYAAYYADFAKSELSIANFIIPAVLQKLVRNVYFVFPEWRNFKARRKALNVSTVFGEGKVPKYNLKIGRHADPKVRLAYPDLVEFSYSMLPAERIPAGRRVILDIDFDYFACRDSIHNQMGYEIEVTEAQFRRQDALLQDKSLPFSGIKLQFVAKENGFFVRVAPRPGKEVSHLPGFDEIRAEIKSLVDTLRAKKIVPAAVTLCRSCVSGYCPEEYSRFIEGNLKEDLSA